MCQLPGYHKEHSFLFLPGSTGFSCCLASKGQPRACSHRLSSPSGCWNALLIGMQYVHYAGIPKSLYFAGWLWTLQRLWHWSFRHPSSKEALWSGCHMKEGARLSSYFHVSERGKPRPWAHWIAAGVCSHCSMLPEKRGKCFNLITL